MLVRRHATKLAQQAVPSSEQKKMTSGVSIDLRGEPLATYYISRLLIGAHHDYSLSPRTCN